VIIIYESRRAKSAFWNLLRVNFGDFPLKKGSQAYISIILQMRIMDKHISLTGPKGRSQGKKVINEQMGFSLKALKSSQKYDHQSDLSLIKFQNY
jgi:hypothetical protein